jgi:hypothetical protein
MSDVIIGPTHVRDGFDVCVPWCPACRPWMSSDMLTRARTYVRAYGEQRGADPFFVDALTHAIGEISIQEAYAAIDREMSMPITTFQGAHEVDRAGICVWCRRRVESPDLGCDYKARILALEEQQKRLLARLDVLILRVLTRSQNQSVPEIVRLELRDCADRLAKLVKDYQP